MAEKVMVSEQYLQDVADSIRTKLNTEDKYKPSEFSSKIDEMDIVTPITKGVIIKKYYPEGFVSDVEIVGMDTVPSCAFFSTSGYKHFLANIKNCKIVDDIQTIESSAFSGCLQLQSVNLSNNITSIGNYAFKDCDELQLTSLPSALKTLGNNAFQYCKAISLTTIPSGVTKLNNYIFSGCTKLTELTFLGNITSMGTYVFQGCTNLGKIVLPNVTSIPTLSNTNTFNNTPIADGSGYIYVPDDLVASFQSASNWSSFAAQIKPISELEVTE